jgi:large subunit ribosomal protein L17e
MVKGYAREPAQPAKAAKARATDIRIHFKNTYEVGRVIKGMGLKVAIKYLKDVLNHKRCIPFTRFRNHTGRTAQAKEFGITTGRWPQKSVKVVLGLLQNIVANAAVKGLEEDKLVITHVQINRAPKGRRRCYCAHGRIGPYLSSPSHIEIFATTREEDVKKESNKKHIPRLSRKQIAKQRLRVGEL